MLILVGRHLAAEEDRLDEVQMLLKKGADPNLMNRDKKTPSDLAKFCITDFIEQAAVRGEADF